MYVYVDMILFIFLSGSKASLYKRVEAAFSDVRERACFLAQRCPFQTHLSVSFIFPICNCLSRLVVKNNSLPPSEFSSGGNLGPFFLVVGVFSRQHCRHLRPEGSADPSADPAMSRNSWRPTCWSENGDDRVSSQNSNFKKEKGQDKLAWFVRTSRCHWFQARGGSPCQSWLVNGVHSMENSTKPPPSPASQRGASRPF